MIFVGKFTTKKLAKRFSRYLKSQSIDNDVRDGVELWVLDDSDKPHAVELMQSFLENPNDNKYESAYFSFKQQKRSEDKALKSHYRQYFPRAGSNQITISLVVICVVIYFLTITSMSNAIVGNLIISLPGYAASTVWAHQPWRLVTPMFLHFGILHILFNMFWLYDFGTLMEKKEGKLFYIIFILVASIGSGLLQYFVVGPRFGGMSGVVYALFAYIWVSSKFNLRSGYYMSNDIAFWLIAWFALCFMGIIGNVANYGHLGGLIVGAVVALLKKLVQERR